MKRVAVAIVGRGRPQLRKAILAARRAAAPTATPPVNRGVLSTQVEWTDDSARATVPPAFVEGLEDEVSLRMPTADGDECHLVARVGETLLDVAQRHNLNLDGTCAGELACSTCHCVVGDPAIYANLPRKTAVEEDLLASAWDLRPTSRLSCQIQITPEMDGMDVHFPVSHAELCHQNFRIVDADHTPVREAQRQATAAPEQSQQIDAKKFKNITKSAIPAIFAKHAAQNPELIARVDEYSTLASILPFRANNYVIEELINWEDVPNDPIFQLTFPQPGMLGNDHPGVAQVAAVRAAGKGARAVRAAANDVRVELNPHPAKQREMNVPNSQQADGDIEFVRGMQHKYRETVLFFPSEAQYCHSYCTYCFRWAQFVGEANTQFASNQIDVLTSYLRKHRGISDVLFTGGDPMVLNSKQLGKYLDTIATDPNLDHVQTVRIGSKSLAYWPYKYVTDDDADDMLKLLERVVASGKHVSLMAHFTHPRELSTPVARQAIRRILSTGVQIRCQAPLINHINNDPDVWATMWREQVRLGMVPYYMFVERDTGAKNWFGVPLDRALEVYNSATQQLSGLARTARGPSMSCTPGKVHVLGVEVVQGEKVFVLKFLQGRNPKWTDRVFFAQYDDKAAWIDDLKPAFGAGKFFFEDELAEMEEASQHGGGSSGQLY